ncbi:hypothetical protein J3T91_02395 [Bifidobacterium sp. B4001]|uniref:hypothetical protein n=1 Tax=unclassified Bifidobacterium TaxID=2608897 RepID=UPI00226B61A8|nr:MULTISPECIES: hypothetical protein [unclassified Bifidobacterium]MCX8672369.1 hypothetical protein [Bifidobacterium sp. B4079]MCX8680803.1 hypothetical protein [Bifidobacterium sp. B4001]
MGMKFAPSAFKHGVTTEEAIYAIAHSVGDDQQGDDPDVTMFVGHPHAGALDDDWLEVGCREYPQNVVVFHAMPLTDNWRYLLYEDDEEES